MTPPALALENVTKTFGMTEIIQGVDLDIRSGERHAIIGPNGAGKSTLFHLISGKYALTHGRVRLHGKDITALPPYQISRLGRPASHGCVRLHPGNAAKLFSLVRREGFKNTRIVITH